MSEGKKYRLGFLNELGDSFEQLFNDGVGDVNVLFSRMMENVRRAQELNVFRGMSRYKAIVVSTPQVVALGGENEMNFYEFRARIPEIHASIPDPFCYDPDSNEANSARSKHPKFKSK